MLKYKGKAYHRKVLIVVGLFLTFVLFAIIVIYRDKLNLFSNNGELSRDPVLQRQQEELVRLDQQASQYYNQESSLVASLSSSITLPEDLGGVPTDIRSKVGAAIIQKSIEANDITKADVFIEYIMKDNDAAAIEAAKQCYRIASTDERRQFCLNRITELAREQGLIGPTEELPASYYEYKEGVE